jgi:hypothetical protein
MSGLDADADGTVGRKPYLSPARDAGQHVKRVSAAAYRRLELAADAIAVIKRTIEFQGNQRDALAATKMNSYYRTKVMRDPACWELTPEATALAARHPEAAVAAKADLAHGGNCGEHSWLAYHYLRQHAAGEKIARVGVKGVDHRWALVGPLHTEPDSEVAAVDAWVNRPMASLWEDHYKYTPKRDELEVVTSGVADGVSFKAAIAAGLKLSEKGEKLVTKKRSGLVTGVAAHQWPGSGIWDRDEGAEEQYEYLTAGARSEQANPGSEVKGPAKDQPKPAAPQITPNPRMYGFGF